jgi:hypothetical protein
MTKFKWLWLAMVVILLWGSAAFGSGSNDYRSGAGSLSLNQVDSGKVSYSSDTVDWYKVFVPEAGIFIAFLDGRQERDIDLYLYSSSGNLIARGTSNNEDEVVYGRVAGGWYYLKVQTAFSSSGSVDYDIAALFVDHSTGYLRATGDINLHNLHMSQSRVYWIFIVDRDGFFDPDLFLCYGDDAILATGRSESNIDVIKWYPKFSGNYTVAVGSVQGNGYYYVLAVSKSK